MFKFVYVSALALSFHLNANRPGYGFNTEEHVGWDYHEARRHGEEGGDCRQAYPTCPFGDGLLDLVSLLDT